MAHFVQLICAFGDGAAGLQRGNKGGQGGEVCGVAVGDGVAKYYYEGGKGGLEEAPDSNILKNVHHEEGEI